MYKACYLLDTGKFDKLAAWEALLDQERLQKYAQIKNEKVARQSLGAGLLLQLAAGEYLLGENSVQKDASKAGRSGEQQGFLIDSLDGATLRERMEKVGKRELTYRYNESGKPYFTRFPLFFSLSHSGPFILCACSLQEIGADVQRVTGGNWRSLSRRFFTKEEMAFLESLPEEEAPDAFIQLWTRKEAYGKLTGEGVLKVMEVSLLGEMNALSWQQGQFQAKSGERYYYAICEESL